MELHNQQNQTERKLVTFLFFFLGKLKEAGILLNFLIDNSNHRLGMNWNNDLMKTIFRALQILFDQIALCI